MIIPIYEIINNFIVSEIKEDIYNNLSEHKIVQIIFIFNEPLVKKSFKYSLEIRLNEDNDINNEEKFDRTINSVNNKILQLIKNYEPIYN